MYLNNHINPILPSIPTFILLFTFLISLNSFSQEQTYDNMVDRLDEIDNELSRLTLLKESISMEFAKISDFSILARGIINNYDKLETSKVFWEDRLKFISAEPKMELKKHSIDKDSEIQKLTKLINDLKYEQMTLFGNNGINSFFKVRCNSLEQLQNEYNKTSDYYLDQKTKYDEISLKLGKLNKEKHQLEIKLKYMGDQSNYALDPSGCWILAFGNHISEITILKHKSGKYVGTLTVNNLQDYEDGQVVLVVERVSDNTFRGIEYTWSEKPNGKVEKVTIPAMITLNLDNDFITWTSDQTVTMRRCRY